MTNQTTSLYEAEANAIEAIARQLGYGSSDDYEKARQIVAALKELILTASADQINANEVKKSLGLAP